MPIYVRIQGVPGDVPTKGYDDGNWFAADSFGFGIDRELRETGARGGTADINIGVGELQECTISKSMDRATTTLAQFAINGNSPGQAEIDFVEVAGETGTAVAYLRYKLDRCFVKSWSTSGDADDRPTEELALYFNKIAFTVAGSPELFSWDRTRNQPWSESGLRPLPGVDRDGG